MQVGVKSEFQGPQGRLSLYFGNKSERPLERIVCNVPPSPQFLFQMPALPPVIEAKRQLPVRNPPLTSIERVSPETSMHHQL